MNNKESCIDNILSLKLKSSFSTAVMNLELGISDHRAIFLDISSQQSKTLKDLKPKIKAKRRIFSKKNTNSFLNRIKNTHWNCSFKNSFQDNCANFFGKFQIIFEESFPLKFFSNKVFLGNKKAWITEGIKVSSKTKREISRQAKISNDLNFLNYVKQYKKVFRSVCNKAKLMSNSHFIKDSENKSKAAWTIVKSELGCKKSNNSFPDIKLGDKVFVDSFKIAELFNKKFIKVTDEMGVAPCKQDAINLALNGHRGSIFKFNFNFVTESEIIKVMNTLKNKKSAGWDDIPLDLTKKLSLYVAKPLAIVINQSFQNSVFPDNLKYAEVKPLFKKGDRHDIDNYRPVSVLPSFSKVFEKLALNQLLNFLESNFLFANEQYGFRKGRSTIAAISDLVDEVSWALDGSHSSMGVFCDLSKAFDCVDHNILLGKMELFNFSSESIGWMSSYLENRKQRTVVCKNNVKCNSQWESIKAGVPQGSILGPLLFLLYINDLPNNINSKLILFADDTTVILKANSLDQLEFKVNQCFMELSDWFKCNGLKLNQGKTQLVNFRTFQARDGFDKEVIFQGQEVSTLENAKFLGIHLDSNFSWNKCIEYIAKKINTSNYQMLILRDVTDLKTRIMIYYAYFFSIVQYGIEFWGVASEADKIFIIQKRFLRIMTFSPWRTSCKPIFKELNILTIPCLYILKVLLWVQSNFDSLSDENFDHGYNTRYRNDFQYPRHRLRLIEKTPKYMGKKLFNKLPSKYKVLITSNLFKSCLTKFVLVKNYYHVNEYINDANM
jgi:hypothetical protein